MDIQKTNNEALIALENGDFLTAQSLFKKNCSSGDYRTFNNLGCFYLENGMTQSNGKTVSGVGYGKKYIKKAYDIKKTETVLLNMAMIMTQYDKKYDEAYKLYKLAYNENACEDYFYNMNVCLYELKKHKTVVDLMKSCDLSCTENFLLYVFSLMQINRVDAVSFIKKNSRQDIIVDEDLRFLLSYFRDETDITMNDLNKFLCSWSPDIYIWAVVIDVLVRLEITNEKILNIIKQTTDGYSNQKQIIKELTPYIYDPIKRKTYIQSVCYYRPTIKMACGYFGCHRHCNEWEQ